MTCPGCGEGHCLPQPGSELYRCEGCGAEMAVLEVRSEERWIDNEDIMSGGQQTQDVGASSSGHGSLQIIQY